MMHEGLYKTFLNLMNKNKYDIIFNTLGRKYTNEEIQKCLDLISGGQGEVKDGLVTSGSVKSVARPGMDYSIQNPNKVVNFESYS